MSKRIAKIISVIQEDQAQFAQLVTNPEGLIKAHKLEGEDAAVVQSLSKRTRQLVMFTPSTLRDLSKALNKFDAAASTQANEAFTDQFQDAYKNNDEYINNYTNSGAEQVVNSWTQMLSKNMDFNMKDLNGFR